MSASDRLSIEQVEEFISDIDPGSPNGDERGLVMLGQQLLDTMRENEMLRKRVDAAENYIAKTPCNPDTYSPQWKTYCAWLNLMRRDESSSTSEEK